MTESIAFDDGLNFLVLSYECLVYAFDANAPTIDRFIVELRCEISEFPCMYAILDGNYEPLEILFNVALFLERLRSLYLSLIPLYYSYFLSVKMGVFSSMSQFKDLLNSFSVILSVMACLRS